MTPAIDHARKAKVGYQIHQYTHDPAAESYGEEAAQKLGLDSQRVFKTLVVSLQGKQLAVAILPVAHLLNLKAVALAFKAKKAVMADPVEVERVTGYVLGGVSPLGQKKRLPTVIDESARYFSSIFVSAGRRGLEIELAADDLASLVEADFAGIVR